MYKLRKCLLLFAAFALLSLPVFVQAQADVPQPSGSIAVGETVEGALTTDAPALVYTLNAEPGQAVTVRLNSNDFDAYLSLLDADGAVLAENDDAGSSRNSAVESFIMPDSGSVLVMAESLNHHWGGSGDAGSFTLIVVEQAIDRIEYTQVVEDDFNEEIAARNYLFTGQAGDIIEIALESDDFDARLSLRDATGAELVSNDDSLNSRNSLIAPFALPETGSYLIHASSYSGDAVGSFTLRLNRIEITPIEFGEPVEGEFTDQVRIHYFSFAGKAGELVAFDLNSDGVSSDLMLKDADSYDVYLEYDYDASTQSSKVYQQTLFADGTFTVLVYAEGTGSGTFNLTTTLTTPASLDDGVQTVEGTSSSRALTFAGNADEVVTLTIQALDGASGSPNVGIHQNGENIAGASGTSVDSLSFSFVTPYDDDVLVQIIDYSYSYEELAYEVFLVRHNVDD